MASIQRGQIQSAVVGGANGGRRLSTHSNESTLSLARDSPEAWVEPGGDAPAAKRKKKPAKRSQAEAERPTDEQGTDEADGSQAGGGPLAGAARSGLASVHDFLFGNARVWPDKREGHRIPYVSFDLTSDLATLGVHEQDQRWPPFLLSPRWGVVIVWRLFVAALVLLSTALLGVHLAFFTLGCDEPEVSDPSPAPAQPITEVYLVWAEYCGTLGGPAPLQARV